MKKIFLTYGLIATGATVAIVSTFNPWFGVFSNQKYPTASDKQKEFVFKNDMNQNETIVDQLDKADLNIFFTATGVQPFYNMIRLSMLAKTETLFYYVPEYTSYQKNLNEELLRDFLRNKKSTSLNTEATEEQKKQKEEEYKKSDVINLKYMSEASFASVIDKVLEANKDKKINLWLNSNNLRYNNHLFSSLIKNPNVIIQAIEDSNIFGNHALDQIEKHKIVDNFFDKENDVWKQPYWLSVDTQYLAANFYDSINFYWTNNVAVDKFSALKIKNHFHFFSSNTQKEIKDFIFSTRDKDNKRLSTYWADITSQNWQKDRDVVSADKEQNKRESIIILGTGRESDKDLITTVAQKYGSQYNIYYKGHPGKNETATWLTNNFSKANNKISYFDYVQNKQSQYTTLQDVIVKSLETQIPSEELTTNNALVENGLWFNKWIAADITSSALLAMDNKVNQISDLIMILSPDQKSIYSSDTNSETYNFEITNLARKLSEKVISVNLKADVDKNKTEFQKEDFEISVAADSGFKNPEIVSVSKQDDSDLYQIKLTIDYLVAQKREKYTITISKLTK